MCTNKELQEMKNKELQELQELHDLKLVRNYLLNAKELTLKTHFYFDEIDDALKGIDNAIGHIEGLHEIFSLMRERRKSGTPFFAKLTEPSND